MLYRIKIVRCLDIITEFNDLDEAIKYSHRLLEEICGKGRIYIHVVKKDNTLRDGGVVYSYGASTS